MRVNATCSKHNRKPGPQVDSTSRDKMAGRAPKATFDHVKTIVPARLECNARVPYPACRGDAWLGC